MLEIVFDEWGEFFLKPSQTTCDDVAVWQISSGFLTPRLNYFLQFSSCGPWGVFSYSNCPSHRALGRYRLSLPGSFVTFYVDWKFLIIALMVEMGIFTTLALFLKPLNSFVKLNYLLIYIRNIFFGFSHCNGWLREFGLCFPTYLYFFETGSHGWIISCS